MQKLTGHVRKLEDKPRSKCRLWELVVNLPKSGRRYPRKTERFDGSYREAQAALRDLIDRVERGLVGLRSDMGFSEYADMWHAKRDESGLYATRTMEREPFVLEAAKMHLADRKLWDISTVDIETMYAALMRGETPSGKPYGTWTLRTVNQKLAKLFKDAVSAGHVQSSPVDGARMPKVPETNRTVPATPLVDEMAESMDASDTRCLMVLLCAMCGLRKSEALALEWEDYDGKRIRVERSMDDYCNVIPTKTGATRTVPVPEKLREKMDANRMSGRICPITPHSLSRWWASVRSDYGMDGVTLHALRHSYATRLAEAGVHPRVMMELGGWKSVDVCMAIYTHVDSALSDAVESAFAEHV